MKAPAPPPRLPGIPRRLARRAKRWPQQRLEHRRLEEARAERLRRAQASTGLLLDVGTHVHLPGWIRLDIEPDEHALRLDASKPWPLPDGCARAVRTEHMIEHLTWDEAVSCIGEIARVLEPGGLVRICTPDLEGIVKAYLERDQHLLDVHREDGYIAPTWSHMPNNYLRMWGHQYVFDFEALRLLLEGAGFGEVERTGFNVSRHPLLDGTDSHDPGELESLVLCVDAVRTRRTA